MFDLNLPAYPYKVKSERGKKQIFDRLRKKFVNLTPEEWVRQHMVHFLIEYKHYPAERMVNEAQIKVNGLTRRCDTVVYDNELKPQIILELKAPTVKIDQHVFEQISAYNWVLKSSYIIVSNGLNHYCCRYDYTNVKVEFMSEIPDYLEIR